MKIGFYNPYFESMSGGERYVLTLASHWSRVHDVFLFWDDPEILEESEKRLHIDLSHVQTTENVFKTKNVFKKLAVSRRFDLIFFLTDGSIPTTFARRNILHFQVPFQKISVHPVKLARFGAVVCNSHFTKDYLDRCVGKRAIVIYPPVEPIKSLGSAKRNIILSVGRFHPLKKQDVLIEIFRKGMSEKLLTGFELRLAGGLQHADKKYYDELHELAEGLPVRFFPNAEFNDLTRLYNESLLYWHAAGFGQTRPENMEHFGITTVEAMSAGCIPVVFKGGGQREIVQKNFWMIPQECLKLTLEIIENKSAQKTMVKEVIQQSKKFTADRFLHAFDSLLSDVTR